MIHAIVLRYLPNALAVASACFIGWYVYYALWTRGNDACQAEWDAASAKTIEQRDAELEVARIRGDALSRELADKERQYNALHKEYLTYANAIPGVCDPRLGVLVSAASAGKPLPATPGASTDPAAAVTTAAIAGNIAENYTRAWECIARLNALIDWHTSTKSSVSKKKEEE